MKPGPKKSKKSSKKYETKQSLEQLKPEVKRKYKKLRKSIDMDPKINQDFKDKMRRKLDETIFSHKNNFQTESIKKQEIKFEEDIKEKLQKLQEDKKRRDQSKAIFVNLDPGTHEIFARN